MLGQIDPNDYYSFITFQDVVEIVHPLTLFSEINLNKLKNKIDDVKLGGGNDFV